MFIIAYYINIKAKGKVKNPPDPLFFGGKENNTLQSAAIWSMMDTTQTESRKCPCVLTESA